MRTQEEIIADWNLDMEGINRKLEDFMWYVERGQKSYHSNQALKSAFDTWRLLHSHAMDMLKYDHNMGVQMETQERKLGEMLEKYSEAGW